MGFNISVIGEMKIHMIQKPEWLKIKRHTLAGLDYWNSHALRMAVKVEKTLRKTMGQYPLKLNFCILLGIGRKETRLFF